MPHRFYDADHEAFREGCGSSSPRDVTPHLDEWEESRETGRTVWQSAMSG